MNNLKPVKIQSFPVDIDGDLIHIIPESDTLVTQIFYVKGEKQLCLKTGEKNEIIYETEDKIIQSEFLSTHNKISITTSSKVLFIDCTTKKYNSIDINELRGIFWSRSFDLFVAILEDNAIEVFEFSNNGECLLQSSGSLMESAPQTETVGWGSENSQFHMDKRVEDENNEREHSFPIDNEELFVSWAVQESEFVVSYVYDGKREFKVFDRLCAPKSVCKLHECMLYGALAWQPGKGIIAAAMFYKRKNCVGFFERNGLIRHILQMNQLVFPIVNLMWSSCGRILCVVQQDDSNQKHVSLYALNNYEWFMKQHLIFPENSLKDARWLPSITEYYKLNVITKNRILQYTYRCEYQHDHRCNTVASIDGNKILFYNFDDSVVPQPSNSIELPNSVNMIEFHHSRYLVAAIDCMNFIYIIYIEKNLKVLSKKLLYEQVFPLNVNHLVWMKNNPLVIIYNSSKVSLHEFYTDSNQLKPKQDLDITSEDIDEIVCVDEAMIIYGNSNKRVYSFVSSPKTVRFPLSQLQVLPFKFDSQVFCFTLTTDQELYLEDELISRGITSVMKFSQYLLFTDNSTLYTIELDLDRVSTTFGLDQCHKKPLNEAMHLVAIGTNATSVILSTSRGNIEIVSSTLLGIRFIKQKIASGHWDEAVSFMRLFKFNWNLLIDLDPESFYRNFEKVISICFQEGVLNAVINEITDEDYESIRKITKTIPPQRLNKRKEFSKNLTDLFEQNEFVSRYLPTVMKLCLDQGDLRKVMVYCSNLLKNGGAENLLIDAIKLMKLSKEPHDIFNAALLVYDLDLAKFVAAQCQINPQEVDLILEKLRNSNQIDLRLNIHIEFQNWREALPYLLRSKSYDEEYILQFIQKHDLAKAAYLESLKMKLPYEERIVLLYVEKLASERRYKEAGGLCVRYKLHARALEFFKLGLEYQKCIECLRSSTLNEESQEKFLRDLAQKLLAANKIEEAAFIYQHLHDYSTAVLTLAEGNKFLDAFRIGKAHNLNELLESQVRALLSQRLNALKIQFEETHEIFAQFSVRLEDLRNTKREKMMNLAVSKSSILPSLSFGQNIASDHSLRDNDLESIISWSSTVSSSASSSSRKMLRKLEKKKQDTSEGSFFEDIALIRELHMMITTIFECGSELSEIFRVHLEHNLMKILLLKEYQRTFSRVQENMIEKAKIIWNEDFRSDSPCTYISENFNILDEKYRKVPPEMTSPGMSWVLSILED